MKTWTFRIAAILLTAVAGACRTAAVAAVQPAPPIVQPGAPGQPSRVITADRAADLSHVGHTPADVRFMQGMIGHHEQAVEMTALISSHTENKDVRALGARMSRTQADEISMMQRWLAARGAAPSRSSPASSSRAE